MKKLLIVIMALVVLNFLGTYCFAEGSLSNDLNLNIKDMPGVKQGLAFDGNGQEIKSLTSVDFVTYKEKIGLGLGLLSDLDNSFVPVLALNYKISGLEDLGFTYPLAKFINLEVGVFGGRQIGNDDNLDQKALYHYGVMANVIKVKF